MTHKIRLLVWTQISNSCPTSRKIFNYVGYSDEVLGEKLEWVHRKSKHVLISKDEKFIYIPLLDNLAQLFK